MVIRLFCFVLLDTASFFFLFFGFLFVGRWVVG